MSQRGADYTYFQRPEHSLFGTSALGKGPFYATLLTHNSGYSMPDSKCGHCGSSELIDRLLVAGGYGRAPGFLRITKRNKAPAVSYVPAQLTRLIGGSEGITFPGVGIASGIVIFDVETGIVMSLVRRGMLEPPAPLLESGEAV